MGKQRAAALDTIGAYDVNDESATDSVSLLSLHS